MGVRKDIKLIITATLTVSLAAAAGCATETGRSTVGGLVYGSMVGTSIAPGIGSAIGAGVGMLAGALEGAQQEQERKFQEEAYRQKFYRLRNQDDKYTATQEGISSSPQSPSQSDRYSNLLALHERKPLATLLERDTQQPVTTNKTLGSKGGLDSPKDGPAEDTAPSRIAKLYQELAVLHRGHRDLEDKVNRLAGLLEEYDRTGRSSHKLIYQMEETLGLSSRKVSTQPPSKENKELTYLQKEYDLARHLNNGPLAEAIASRYESLSGHQPIQDSGSSSQPGYQGNN